MFVKICGLREAEHVRTAVDAGADAIGLVLTDSPRFVTPETARDLISQIDREAGARPVLTVGVFRDESPAEIARLADAASVDAVQVHGQRTQDEIAQIVAQGRPIIRAVAFDDPTITHTLGEAMLLIDAPRPGSGEAWNYASMAHLSQTDAARRWLLAGGLTPATVADAVRAARPWGVDVSSGIETAPGLKSSELIREFVAAARSAS